MEWKYKGVTLTQKHFDLFWSKVNPEPNYDDCWYWNTENNISNGGYGRVNFQNHIFHSNQLAYLFYYGEIEEGKIILHSKQCIENAENDYGNGKLSRLCCNPKHLRQGTYKENNNDTKEQGRMMGWFQKGRKGDSGENHPQHKLSSLDVEAIRLDHSKHKDIAHKYGIAMSTVSRIKSGLRRAEG